MNCGILVYSGSLILEKSLVTLKFYTLIYFLFYLNNNISFIVKRNNSLIIGIAVNQDSYLEISQCEIKGNQNHDTIGILSKFTDLKV